MQYFPNPALALVPFFLCAAAQAQTLPAVSSAFATELDTATGSQVGLWTQAEVFDWTPRLPLDPSVELTAVRVDATIALEATVTVRNPSSAPVTGAVTFRYGYYSIGGQGNWGGFDASNYTDGILASGMQPGETRTLTTWTWTDRSLRTHIEMSGDPWVDVRRDVLGLGQADYVVSSFLQIESITGGLEIVSADLRAEASGDMSIRGLLSPAAGVTDYCPSVVNTSGQRAELAAFGAPYPGSTGFRVLATGLPGLSPAVLIATNAAASLPSAGGTICIGGARIFQSPVAQVPIGTGTLFFDAPLDGAVPGTSVFAQVFFREPTGFSLSNALEISL